MEDSRRRLHIFLRVEIGVDEELRDGPGSEHLSIDLMDGVRSHRESLISRMQSSSA